MGDEPKSIETPYGTFRPRRHNCVAISVMRVKRTIFSQGKVRQRGEFSFIEHRKWPKQVGNTYWAWYCTTYDREGRRLVLDKQWRPATPDDDMPCVTDSIDELVAKLGW
jgi:hypothetical protein